MLGPQVDSTKGSAEAFDLALVANENSLLKNQM